MNPYRDERPLWLVLEEARQESRERGSTHEAANTYAWECVLEECTRRAYPKFFKKLKYVEILVVLDVFVTAVLLFLVLREAL